MRKGSHQSEEAKQKISKSMIEVRKTINPMKGRTGDKHPNYGKPMSEEQKKKLSESHKGKPSNRKGTKHSDETKQRISDSKKGSIPWNKGLKTGPHTEDHNIRIAESIAEWWEELPEEIKLNRNKKISNSKKNNLGHIGYCGSYYTNKNMQKVWLRSSYEVRIATFLDNHDIEWEYEPEVFDLDGKCYHPDFYLPKYDLWWEVKGYLNDNDYIKLNKFCEKYNKKIKLIFKEDIELLEECSDHLSEYIISNIGTYPKFLFNINNKTICLQQKLNI